MNRAERSESKVSNRSRSSCKREFEASNSIPVLPIMNKCTYGTARELLVEFLGFGETAVRLKDDVSLAGDRKPRLAKRSLANSWRMHVGHTMRSKSKRLTS